MQVQGDRSEMAVEYQTGGQVRAGTLEESASHFGDQEELAHHRG